MTREKAIKELEQESCYECTWGCESPINCTCPKCDLKDALKMAIKALKDRPHGKWIFKHNSADIWCSNCDENFDEIPQKFLFCPNCGADMREGEVE